MKLAVLPVSTPIGASDDPTAIATFLRVALAKEPHFHYSAAVEGAPNSGRIIAVAECAGLTPLSGPLTAAQTARQIVLLMPEARYNPCGAVQAKKGWTVQKAEIGGKPAVIVWATWIH